MLLQLSNPELIERTMEFLRQNPKFMRHVQILQPSDNLKQQNSASQKTKKPPYVDDRFQVRFVDDLRLRRRFGKSGQRVVFAVIKKQKICVRSNKREVYYSTFHEANTALSGSEKILHTWETWQFLADDGAWYPIAKLRSEQGRNT